MTWNLNMTGHGAEAELVTALQDFVNDLEADGQKVFHAQVSGGSGVHNILQLREDAKKAADAEAAAVGEAASSSSSGDELETNPGGGATVADEEDED